MKCIILTAIAVITLFFAGGNMCAQNALEGKVPFDFYVGKTVMQSGTYRIAPISYNVLIVRNSTTGSAVMHLTYANGMEWTETPVLIFNKYSASPAKYFLREVRGLPMTGNLALPVSSLEKELQGTVRVVETFTFPPSDEPQ